MVLCQDETRRLEVWECRCRDPSHPPEGPRDCPVGLHFAIGIRSLEDKQDWENTQNCVRLIANIVVLVTLAKMEVVRRELLRSL